MAEEKNQKIKLLKIMEILRQETDEEHPMTKVELAARLVAMNVSCSPRSLIRDIKLLNEQGYEIMERLIGHEKAYFVCDRSFSVPELKILIDAVQAASFVTNKKTGELIDKIAALGGSHRAAILKGNMVKFNARKHRKMTRVNDHTIEATVQVRIAPTFWGWLTQFAGDMTITAPETAIKEYKEHLLKELTMLGDI